MEFWQRRNRLCFCHRGPPLREGMKRRLQSHASKDVWTAIQIPASAGQKRLRSSQVAGRVMMESHGDLDKSLKELLFGPSRSAPQVFPSLMRVEEFGMIKMMDGAQI